MDPNAALKELREEFELWSQTPIGSQAEAAITATIAERFGALDDWLSRGGFLPEAWAR